MEEIDIKDFLGYLKKFLIPMIIVSILAVGASIFYNLALKTPLYKTSTTVVLAQKTSEKESASVTLNDISINQKLVATYTEIVKSKLVLEQVINDLAEIHSGILDGNDVFPFTLVNGNGIQGQLLEVAADAPVPPFGPAGAFTVPGRLGGNRNRGQRKSHDQNENQRQDPYDTLVLQFTLLLMVGFFGFSLIILQE